MYPSPHVRVSDADREAIVARLSTATAEGRLTIEEFSERSRQAYESRTWGDLSAVVHDLPSSVLTQLDTAAPPAAAPGSRLPLFSMIAGLVSLPLLILLGMPALFSAIAAVILGAKSLRAPARHGRAQAITGLICGALSLILMTMLVTIEF
ncbi:DUF1707 SHOCT-like domain-containing protein [Actinoplanes regularis]|uniref:DUF1707 SHOCT-like domain-containing protein n=1 Tax=Actinoplanes regularis TaxID=52697 RepID=UPI0024A2B8FC|nr:DUF1707 domain-containing protein [Actinoplanes regularis]GLW27415.1 hypothetical protein Areg01_03560 [Actinoplanes regularis]